MRLLKIKIRDPPSISKPRYVGPTRIVQISEKSAKSTPVKWPWLDPFLWRMWLCLKVRYPKLSPFQSPLVYLIHTQIWLSLAFTGASDVNETAWRQPTCAARNLNTTYLRSNSLMVIIVTVDHVLSTGLLVFVRPAESYLVEYS